MQYSKNKIICKQPSATIYLGQEKTTGNYAALKQFNPQYAAAFQHQFHTLQKLQGHPNIIKLIAVDPNNKVIIEQCMYQNILQLYISSQNRTNQLQAACILLQGAMALHHLHSLGYVHRDVKPQNLMFQRTMNHLKLIDFGWTTKIQNSKTHQCCTRWYRAPQSLLQLGNYTQAVDIFGLGCSIAQFFQQRALFQGQNTLSQLYKIFELTGVPKESQWPEGYHKMKQLGLTFQVSQSKSLKSSFSLRGKDSSVQLQNILKRMLQLNPKRRISCIEIIRHPYFSSVGGFSAKDHLPAQVYQRYQKYLYGQSLTEIPRVFLKQMQNLPKQLKNLKLLNNMKGGSESETSILDSMKKLGKRMLN